MAPGPPPRCWFPYADRPFAASSCSAAGPWSRGQPRTQRWLVGRAAGPVALQVQQLPGVLQHLPVGPLAFPLAHAAAAVHHVRVGRVSVEILGRLVRLAHGAPLAGQPDLAEGVRAAAAAAPAAVDGQHDRCRRPSQSLVTWCRGHCQLACCGRRSRCRIINAAQTATHTQIAVQFTRCPAWPRYAPSGGDGGSRRARHLKPRLLPLTVACAVPPSRNMS